MDKLNLPVFKDPLPRSENLSMEAYLEFLKWCFRVRRAGGAEEPPPARPKVGVPFRLK